MRRLAPLLLIALLVPEGAPAHGGRTDSSGCHNDRKSGGYHCHGGGRSTGSSYMPERSPPPAPMKFEVVAVPRARVFVAGVDLGVTPTKAQTTTARTIEVEVRHPLLGTTRQTFTLSEGRTSTLQVQW